MTRQSSIGSALALLAAGALALLLAQPAQGAPVVTQATGSDAADIQTAVEEFRDSLGGLNPPGTPPQAEGRRQINWDGGRPDPADFSGSHLFSDPFFMPFAQFRGFGTVFGTPGRGFKMSADPDPALAGTPADVPPNFGTIDPSYASTFAPFSEPRLFTSIGSNVINVRFVRPGTDEDAQTDGFGVVFSNVGVNSSTTIEYFAPNGRRLDAFAAPATSGSQTFSFLGVRYTEGEQVARARITQGTAPLAEGTLDVSQGGTDDLVVTDDFILGEPQEQDLSAPRVRIHRAPPRETRRKGARLAWRTDKGLYFRCRLTKQGSKNRREQRLDRWRRCEAPITYRNLRPGIYTFRVIPFDASFNRGQPQAHRWAVRR